MTGQWPSMIVTPAMPVPVAGGLGVGTRVALGPSDVDGGNVSAPVGVGVAGEGPASRETVRPVGVADRLVAQAAGSDAAMSTAMTVRSPRGMTV
jgi:hypothetical protein